MNSNQSTTPPRAGLPQGETIDLHRYRSDMRRQTPLPDMPLRATSRFNEAWKQVRDADGSLKNYRCPRCKIGIVRHRRIHGNLSPVVECDNEACTWTLSQMTGAERADLAARDPEAVRIADHENHITGKERRLKKFLSKCSRGGC